MMVPMPLVLGGVYTGNHYMQHYLGSSDDFFNGSFITEKDADSISEFYQAEDLLKIIAIFPFMFDQVMNKVVPDVEEATEETALLNLGETHFNVNFVGMEVSFEIIEHEEPSSDGGDPELKSFIRHERFIDWAPLLKDMGVKILLWDQTWKYGFRTLDDGKIEVYHHGESFFGPWPVRLIVMLHQRYVLWACENYINGAAFGTEDIDSQQEQMGNIPLWKIQQLLATIRHEKEKSLETQMNAPRQDLSAIAEHEADIEKLKKLEARDQPAIALVKKKQPPAGFATGGETVRMVVSDGDIHEALESARQDAKGNRAVNAALQELTQVEGLEWQARNKQPRNSTRTKKSTMERETSE